MTLCSRQSLFTSFALLAAACGGGARSGVEAESPAFAESSSQRGPSPAPVAGIERAETAASAPAGEAAEDQSYESGSAAPEARPGLGTTWGEDRFSRVTETPFDRRTPSVPFAVATLHYNDRAGVGAMSLESSRSWGDNALSVRDTGITVRLLDEFGRPLPSTHAGGRAYVIGEAGQRYSIEVSNHTGNRVEAVATVDGLDVIDGRAGSFEKRGYLLAPYGTVCIDGFRRSNETVAAFRFGSVSESYAELKGEGRNVGVVGVAFFDEAGARWPWTDDEVRRRHDADPFPGRYAEPPWR